MSQWVLRIVLSLTISSSLTTFSLNKQYQECIFTAETTYINIWVNVMILIESLQSISIIHSQAVIPKPDTIYGSLPPPHSPPHQSIVYIQIVFSYCGGQSPIQSEHFSRCACALDFFFLVQMRMRTRVFFWFRCACALEYFSGSDAHAHFCLLVPTDHAHYWLFIAILGHLAYCEKM